MIPTLNPLNPFTGQYVAPTAAVPMPVADPTGTQTPATLAQSHKAIVSVIIVVIMAVVFTQIAGVGPQWATMITLMLVGLILALGMSHIGQLSNFSNQYPSLP